MSETTTLSQLKPDSENKIDQTHKVLGIVSTSLGILGAAGTVLVGLIMNFYVGDVEIQPDKTLDSVVVKVYDNKGHEAVFHSTRFQMMPGNYSLDIIPGSGKALHADMQVQFRETSVVHLAVPASEPQDLVPDSQPDQGKKHWWQFWRH